MPPHKNFRTPGKMGKGDDSLIIIKKQAPCTIDRAKKNKGIHNEKKFAASQYGWESEIYNNHKEPLR
jgi:hypothetical protein